MKHAPDTAIANALYTVARSINRAADILMWRSAKVGLVYFSWSNPWRRWRIVRRTETTVPWVELGPVDIVFQDRYKGQGGYGAD